MEAQTHRPVKGILKNTGSAAAGVRVVSKAELNRDRDDDDQSKKSQKWDEMNILATYHPLDKDYGLMKIDEPSTPYHRMADDDEDGAMSDSECNEALTADVLAQKLEEAEGKDPKFLAQEESSDEEEDEELTPEEREKKREFEKKRKHHYNEGMNIKLARQLIAKELAGEDDEDDEDEEMQDITDTEALSDQLQSIEHLL